MYKPGTKEVEQWLSFDLMNTHATEQAFVAGGDSIGLKFDQCFTMLTFDHAHGDHALLSPTVPAETDDAQYVPVSRVTCDSRARRALHSETVGVGLADAGRPDADTSDRPAGQAE